MSRSGGRVCQGSPPLNSTRRHWHLLNSTCDMEPSDVNKKYKGHDMGYLLNLINLNESILEATWDMVIQVTRDIYQIRDATWGPLPLLVKGPSPDPLTAHLKPGRTL